MKKSFYLLCALIGLSGCFSKNDNTIEYGLDFIPVEYDNTYIYLDMSSGKKAQKSQVYDEATFFYDGIAAVKTNGTYKFINKQFKPISNDTYSAVTRFNDGVAYAVKPNGHIVAINKSGKPIFELTDADYAFPFNDGVSVISTKDNSYGLINKNGKILIPAQNYFNMGPFGFNGMIRVSDGTKEGICSYDNKEIIPCEYDNIRINQFTGKTFIVSKYDSDYNEVYGVVDMKNKEIIPIEYDKLVEQPDGNYLFEKYYRSKGEKRYGWINSKGEEIIAPLFSDAEPFLYAKLAPAANPSNGKIGFIDKLGDWVIEPKYNDATIFTDNGLAMVENDVDEMGAINTSGKYVIKAKYDDMDYLGKGLYWVENNGTYGIINSKGEQVVRMTDSYRYKKYNEIINENNGIKDQYVDIDDIANRMMKVVNKLRIDNLSMAELEKIFNIGLNRYGWTTLDYQPDYMPDERTGPIDMDFSSTIDAFVDYESNYSFYNGYSKKYYLSKIKIEFELNDGKVFNSRDAIFNTFAKRLGISEESIKNAPAYNNPEFPIQDGLLPSCNARLINEGEWCSGDFDGRKIIVEFTPISGKIV